MLSVQFMLHAQWKGTFPEFVDSVSTIIPDSTSARTVSGVLFVDGPITLALDSGVVVFSKPFKDKPLVFWFIGNGTIQFSPTESVEQLNISRFYKGTQVVEPFTEFIAFCTNPELISSLEEGDKTVFPKEWARVKKGKKLLFGEDDKYALDTRLTDYILNNLSEHGITAVATKATEPSIVVQHIPNSAEPYRLGLTKESGRYVNASVSSGAPTTHFINDDGSEPDDIAFVKQHTIECRIDRGLNITASDRLDINIRVDSALWIPMYLDPDLEVDSVVSSDKEQLEYSYSKGSLYVQLPFTMKKGANISITLYYHGDIFSRVEEYTVLQTSTGWYANIGSRHLSYFDVVFTHPESMTLVSIGKKTNLPAPDNHKSSRWVIGRPIRNASFHIGFFKELSSPPVDSIPSSTLLYRTNQNTDVVSTDIRQALEFYTKLFGKLPVDHVNVAELPGTHGEAFPGLVHLSSYALLGGSDSFFEEQFTSHEIAHQWWGIGLDFTSYRDQWLSEGIAEYSALMYTQTASTVKNKMLDLLKDYKKQLFSRGKKTFGDDDAQPPIYIGSRAISGGYSSDRNLYVYYKPAWVIHMYRNMFLDLNTMKEDIFLKTMKTFYQRFQGKHASTEDFQRVAEEVSGAKLGWFFQQWIYGNEMPRYTVAWKSEKTEKGDYRGICRVKQEGTSNDFGMPVIFKVIFADGSFLRIRKIVVGNQSEVNLGLFLREPKEIIFNDLESVLGTVETESYD